MWCYVDTKCSNVPYLLANLLFLKKKTNTSSFRKLEENIWYRTNVNYLGHKID